MVLVNSSVSVNEPILVVAVFLTLALSLFVLRKFAKHEYDKNEQVKNTALSNISQIEYMNMKGREDVVCVIKMKDKEPEIAAYGIEAVKLYTKVIAQRPELDNLQ